MPAPGAESPTQRLAAAVLKRAVCDAAGLIGRYRYSPPKVRDRGWPQKLDEGGQPLTRESIQREALLWLTTPSDGLEFWCGQLGLDEQTMIDNVDAAIEHALRSSKMKER